MDDLEALGWFKVGAQSYRHYSGGRVAKRGRQWTATAVTGAAVGGHPTALQAMSYLEEYDSSFWSYGVCALGGANGVICCKLGFRDAAHRERREGWLVCYLNGGDSLPAFHRPIFEKHLFGIARCTRCLSAMAMVETRALREFDKSGSTENLYFVCVCGHPVWSVPAGTTGAFMRAFGPAETRRLRKERLRLAGGRHSSRAIREVLALQENRCLYCNRQFTGEVSPTKDHLLAIADGGTDWDTNLVMACWRCNCRRSDIPFRTYCKLLSRRQNQRILTHLVKRIVAMDILNLPGDAMAAFDGGLALHDARHPRFLNMQRRSVIVRRNVALNRLLPPTRSLIIKKHQQDHGR